MPIFESRPITSYLLLPRFAGFARQKSRTSLPTRLETYLAMPDGSGDPSYFSGGQSLHSPDDREPRLRTALGEFELGGVRVHLKTTGLDGFHLPSTGKRLVKLLPSDAPWSRRSWLF